MTNINSQRRGCKDVFNSFLVDGADYEGIYEFPVIKATYKVPTRLIRFSEAVSCKDYNQWIHFYEDDQHFERIWRNPKKYLPVLKRFEGVILPDFSLYRDMPLSMQVWNIYRSRAIGYWLQKNGIDVIPNIRFGDYRTFRYSCDGISTGCVIAFGSHGTMRGTEDKKIFLEGFEFAVARLKPSVVIVYGTFPKDWIAHYAAIGIEIICFKSDYAISHEEVV